MSVMPEQLDLFSSDGPRPAQPLSEPAKPADVNPSDLDDAALLIGIRNARQSDCLMLAQEAGRRRLVAAVAELEQLCLRFSGFGRDRTIREQMAAVEGLAMIGGREAAQAIRRIAVDEVIAGPGLACVTEAAARLGAHLPADIVATWLHHPDPVVRANACRCARGGARVTDVLVELLNDLNGTVAREAACALGRLGRTGARVPLMRMLQQAPSAEIIQAIEAVADEDCLVLLGRIGRARPALTDAVIMALENFDSARAARIRETLRCREETLS
jgi:hypothetical protein